MATRKIVTAALPIKAAPKAVAPKIVTAAPVKAAKVEAPPKIIVAPKTPRAPKVERHTHEVVSQYAGPSAGLNKRKSRTALDIAAFATAPSYVLTERTEKVGKALRAKYAGKAFERANADAGILNYLIRKGYVAHVSGDPASENCMLQFTADGLKFLPAHG
jgi:hypothetical protein